VIERCTSRSTSTTRPIAGGLWHPLNPGEYPSEHERSGIKHVGKFGEIFDTQGGGLQALCALLLGGGAGNSGALPPNWQGLTIIKRPSSSSAMALG
jgi:hypothetical protein